MSDLKTRINEDTKIAMRARDQQRLGALRLVLAAIKQQEVDTRTVLTDPDIIGILQKMLKQRHEALTQFQAANRTDLAAQEQFEIELIHTYLPKPLDEVALNRLIDAALHETSASNIKDMGVVMTRLKSQLQGRADLAQVSAKVKMRLSSST